MSVRPDRLGSRLGTRTRILLATFAPLLLFVSLGVTGAAVVLPRIIRELVLQRESALAQVAAVGVAGEMQGHLRLLQSTADGVSEVVGLSPAEDAQAVQRLLARRAARLEIFTGGVGYVALDGTLLAASPSTEVYVGSNYTDRDYLQDVIETQASVYVSGFGKGFGGNDAIMIAAPVRQRGRVVGALVGEFDLERNSWARNLDLLRTPQGGTASLIDATSRVIYHPDPERIGRSLQTESPFRWQLILGGVPDSQLLTDGGDAPVAVAYAPVPGIAWGVVLEEPWSAVVAPTRLWLWTMVGVWAAGLLMAAGFLTLSVHRALSPLRTVVDEARNVTSGGAFHPFENVGPPDIRTLVNALNRMVSELNAQQTTLRDYARRVLQGQEDERQRISRDLHDDTVQSLVALSQRLELLARAVGKYRQTAASPADASSQVEHPENHAAADRALADAQAQLAQIRELAAATLADVRRMSYNLRPFMLEDLGLSAAVQGLSRDLETQLHGVRATCEIVGSVRPLPAELELTIFRTVQEALNNVRHHAVPGGATQVHVALIYEDWGALTLIEDDGPGVTLPSTEALLREGHLGIVGMMERARLFDGSLDIISAPGEGTTVRLRLETPAPELGQEN